MCLHGHPDTVLDPQRAGQQAAPALRSAAPARRGRTAASGTGTFLPPRWPVPGICRITRAAYSAFARWGAASTQCPARLSAGADAELHDRIAVPGAAALARVEAPEAGWFQRGRGEAVAGEADVDVVRVDARQVRGEHLLQRPLHAGGHLRAVVDADEGDLPFHLLVLGVATRAVATADTAGIELAAPAIASIFGGGGGRRRCRCRRRTGGRLRSCALS